MPAGSPSSSARPLGQRHAGDAGEVGRDGGDVVEVHGHRVVELVAELERRGRCGRADQHVDLLEGRREVVRDEPAHLLRLAVVGVVVAARQRVGAEDDAALHLVAEAGVAGGRHDLLGARVRRPRRAARAGRSASRRTWRGWRTPRSAGSGSRPRARSRSCGQETSTTSAPASWSSATDSSKRAPHAGLVALATELLDDADLESADVGPAGGLDDRRHRGVDGRRVHRVVAADDRVQQGRVEDGARARPSLVEARGERDEAVARDPAVGRLDADRAGDRGGLADRAARCRCRWPAAPRMPRRRLRSHLPTRRGCVRGPTGCAMGP